MKLINKDDRKNILTKHSKLVDVRKTLKKEFVGLDDIIDEVCNLVEPWYLFPKAQIRPTVINLWGMTGTGKTSLVIRLFELLEMSSVLKFDTGEWVDKTDFQLTSKISGQIRKVKKDNLIPIFIFDEFQHGRTIDEHGDELDRTTLRVLWDLLDSGKFDVIEEKWELNSVIKLYTKLNFLLNEKNVVVKNGKVIKNKEAWETIFIEELSDVDDEEQQLINKYYTTDPFIPTEKLWNIKAINEDMFMSEIQLAEYLKTLDGEEILKFIEETVERGVSPVKHDFSDSIVFLIGNLDNAYFNSSEISPDIDADTLYEHTEKINISDIKNTLTFLYRPEQISRLGNNHVIYKSFNKKTYTQLIELELNKIVDKIKTKFDIIVNLDESVAKIIYNEGVFPTQGVRPVFSTISTLIESYVGRIIVDSLKKNLDVISIDWRYDNEEYFITLNTKNSKKEIKYPVILKVDNIRKSKSDDIQSLVGIHEAGHTVASIYTTSICPKLVVSRKADDNGGFTHIDNPEWETKELLLDTIVMLGSGYMAEKLVFGEDNLTTGSYSDLNKITKTALRIVKEYGMNGNPLQYSTPDFRISGKSICLNDDDLDKKAIKIVEECMDRSKKILETNMTLLLKLGEHLTYNSEMSSDEIKDFVKKYGEFVPDYKTKDNYFQFKLILEDKIKKIDATKDVSLKELVLNKKNKRK